MSTIKKPVLHHLNNSQSQRILWLLEELEVSYELRLYKRYESGPQKARAPEELKQIHPLGKSPTLETADGRVLIESSAIAKYLIDEYDTKGQFKGQVKSTTNTTTVEPGPIYDSIRDDTLSSFANASLSLVFTIETLLELMVSQSPFFIRPIFSGTRSVVRKTFTTGEFDKMFRYLDSEIGDQDYFMGSDPGRADFMLSWPVDNCEQWGFVDLTKYPKLKAWHQRCHAREAWKRSLEKGNGYSLRVQ